MSSTSSASGGGFPALVHAYKNNSETEAQSVVSQSADQSFGSQTLSQLDQSVQ
ncbi:hypothetical protein I314_02336 [Cryptococcus bacillisporus CA1873]|uniref:Uncharacterized protein n=1 Tax=Cryptococcus bacillisporus CA1873 TaxID=1296111 RepID=A0ABR5BD73_CRYGA|nr:hypothetical protein I314_02336 [Cryptococcus bacillisporus CA1873]|eukprot:KIR67123.1 hypothetical protein I314_02336 [Cryptococcus gattii CA1873]